MARKAGHKNGLAVLSPCPPEAGLWCGCRVRRPDVRLFWFGTARTEKGSNLDAVWTLPEIAGRADHRSLTGDVPCEVLARADRARVAGADLGVERVVGGGDGLLEPAQPVGGRAGRRRRRR